KRMKMLWQMLVRNIVDGRHRWTAHQRRLHVLAVEDVRLQLVQPPGQRRCISQHGIAWYSNEGETWISLKILWRSFMGIESEILVGFRPGLQTADQLPV